MGRTQAMPCRITPGEFLRLEARLLGRRSCPDAGPAVPTAVRDRRIRARAARGEAAAAIALAVGVDPKTVARVLGRGRPRRRR
jgi:hypothetical protein